MSGVTSLTTIDGTPVSTANPLPAKLVGASVTITGPVTIATEVAVTSAAPTLADGTQSQLSVDTKGNLRVVEGSGVAVTGVTMPVGGVGLTGWLSAIWKALSGILTVSDANNAAVTGVGAITPSDSATLTPGRGLAVICSAPGNITVAFADASTITVPVAVGYQQFPFAITKLMATGTTATATYANLK